MGTSVNVQSDEFEILTDGMTVWVNSQSGMCIGRFSKFGVDVHNDLEIQENGGVQCLDCCHDLPHPEAWDRFVSSMQRHYDIALSEDLRPSYAVAK